MPPARSKARKRALDILFEAEQRGVNAADLLRERLAAPVTEAPLSEFTADLVMGVVEHTDPGLQGDRSTGGTKPATLETGAQIQVPLFITTGEKVKVDTRSGDYLGRA